ncbi:MULTISPECIES: hypothetical protein [unclassified Paenibacillus]|uniref:hypothetical protein n=1 Tax=unclassified Paenibacillus TaxID=185978 RepID=UPI0024073B53|nr:MULTISPECIES: hypothetical protein [unclassified Paenibacillus]MDF9845210.1 hypothetical protein [Paenibacillus sp. PastF-2]MDF9851809.1 hypothetical protein [Paenibacillus sp. PastM-2]MDF9858376.1 hypothetical protein [Paenibacillus sp. PastF-1]MDH6483665.1 hypothetical protein [Paenibacillus sp. PastH-2]
MSSFLGFRQTCILLASSKSSLITLAQRNSNRDGELQRQYLPAALQNKTQA